MTSVYSPSRIRFTVDRFEKMSEAGVFGEDDRIELIDGELVVRAPIGGPHLGMVKALASALISTIGSAGTVSVQNPIALLPDSEPQPDIAVLKPGFRGRDARVPHADDVLLVVEVSDTTPGGCRVMHHAHDLTAEALWQGAGSPRLRKSGSLTSRPLRSTCIAIRRHKATRHGGPPRGRTR